MLKIYALHEILHEKDFSPDSLDCQAPRIWNDQCSDCICDSSNEMWYYELGICDVRECSNPSEKLFIKNNQVITINDIDSTIVYKQVNVLRFIDDMAYIDRGLDRGELLCMTNLDVMYDGMKIRLAQ